MQKAPRNNFFIILILGALSTITPFSIDMYLPAFSQIAGDLQTTTARIALSVSSYFVGLSLGQIFYGPVLDRYGRKKPLAFGLSLYALASIACLQSRSAEGLIAFRFIQALGACVAQVGSMAMVRDYFPVKESAKIFSLLTLILGVSPLLAPTVGSFVTVTLGWHWVFILLATISTLILIVALIFLPEGHQPDPSVSLRMKPIFNGFVEILKVPQFYTYAFAGAFGFAGLFIYVASSPIIFMDIFKVEPRVYGGIFAFLSISFIGASQLNLVLLRKFKNEQIIQVASWVQFLVGLAFFGGVLLGGYTLIPTIAFIFVFMGCVGMAGPNLSALALAPFSRNAGRASALIGFVQMGIGALVSSGVGFFDASAKLMPTVSLLFGTASLALLILSIGKRKIKGPIAVVEGDAPLVMH